MLKSAHSPGRRLAVFAAAAMAGCMAGCERPLPAPQNPENPDSRLESAPADLRGKSGNAWRCATATTSCTVLTARTGLPPRDARPPAAWLAATAANPGAQEA